jgi:GMP synthase-like glutamine amidotransferase
MRALVVAHDHTSPLGPIGEQLERRGYELEHFLVIPREHFAAPGISVAFPDFTAYDMVVVLGAIWSVYDEATIGSWVKDEIEQVRAADSAGVPVLGICFGGQLLAAAHGGSVERSPQPEIGWTDVHSVDESIVPAGPWFEWHFDRWTLPPGAEELASNGAASQAFALRRNLAVQFHPELTGASLLGWLENGGYAGARAAGFDPGLLLTETDRLGADAATRAGLLVDGFLDRIGPR